MKQKLLCFFLIGSAAVAAHATVLWAGGEDIDFPNGSSVCSTTNSQTFRSAFARQSISPCTSGGVLASNVFPGGAVTSVWISARLWDNNTTSNDKYFGIGKSGATGGLWIGPDPSDGIKIALYAWQPGAGISTTWLASESGRSLANSVLQKIDMHVVNYGANATVTIYVNGSTVPNITYTGNVSYGTATSLDTFVVSSGNAWGNSYLSEFIAADTDTRLMSLATLAPSGAGDTNQWTGSYSNINPITINDSTFISDSNSGDIFQATLSPLPSGNFSVAAVKMAARAAQTGTGIGSLSVGVKTNMTVSAPAAIALPTTWSEAETYYQQNPVTASPWTVLDVNALQINLKSAP